MKNKALLLIALTSMALVACDPAGGNTPADPAPQDSTYIPGDNTNPGDSIPSSGNNDTVPAPAQIPYYVGEWESDVITDTLYVEFSTLDSMGIDLSQFGINLAQYGQYANLAFTPVAQVKAILRQDSTVQMDANLLLNSYLHTLPGTPILSESYIPIDALSMDTTLVTEAWYVMTEQQLILTQTESSDSLILDVRKNSDTQVDIKLSEESAEKLMSGMSSAVGDDANAVLAQIEAVLTNVWFKMNKKQ